MKSRHSNKCVAIMLALSLTLTATGCTGIPDETVSSLTDLAASSTGSLVQIAFKAAIDAIIASFQVADLAAPLALQVH